MGKTKRKGTKLHPWQTPQKDNIAPSYTMLDSYFLAHEAVKALKPMDFKTYIALICHSCGQEGFYFPYSQAKDAGIPPKTYETSLKRLQEAGFIKVKKEKVYRNPGFATYSNYITFVSDWKERKPELPPKKARGNPAKIKRG